MPDMRINALHLMFSLMMLDQKYHRSALFSHTRVKAIFGRDVSIALSSAGLGAALMFKSEVFCRHISHYFSALP